MKIQLKSFSLFTRRRNLLFALVFIFVVSTMFVFSAPQAHADCGWWTKSVTDGSCPWEKVGADIGAGVDLLKPAAIAVLSVESAFATAAAGLFAYILDPNSFTSLMNNGVFYEIWKIVRDTMNMIFILVLLFSAFATIYQIDKYRYNKILLTVIIMALLVNFSWPISRTIIDFFNSMMYFFVQSVFKTTGPAAASGILGGTDLKAIFLPKDTASDWPSIFLAIIVMFIFMMTLLVLSLMMFFRLVALPILIMFSPVGFAGMAAPITQKYAKKWWDTLFQYASYGPIVVFMVLVSIRVLGQTQAWKSGMKKTIQGISAGDSSVLETLVYFAIPITLFWIAITSAQKMSGELGPIATTFGSDFSKWAGRLPWRGVKAGFAATGISGGVQQAWKNRRTALLGGSNATRAREEREDRIARGIAGGVSGSKNAAIDAFNKRTDAELETLKKLGNVTKAKEMLNNGSKEQKKAAALYLSEKEALTNAADFQKALQAVGKDFSAARGIISKVPKSALATGDDLSKSLKILNENGNKKLTSEVILKSEKKALGDTGDEYNLVLEELARNDKGIVARDSAGKLVIDDELKKIYDKRIVEQGQAHIRVEANISELKNTTAGPLSPAQVQKAYADVFDRISANDMTKQNEAMMMQKEFVDYMKSKTEASQKEAFAAMARENKENIVKEWKTEGVKNRR